MGLSSVPSEGAVHSSQGVAFMQTVRRFSRSRPPLEAHFALLSDIVL
jgi:hypothetical protein